jgi:hypothetical protein
MNCKSASHLALSSSDDFMDRLHSGHFKKDYYSLNGQLEFHLSSFLEQALSVVLAD